MYGNRHSLSYPKSTSASRKAILVHSNFSHLSLPKTNNYDLAADFALEWTKEYGNIYQLRLFTDNRVRVFIPSSMGVWKGPSSPADNDSRASSCQGTSINLSSDLLLTCYLSIKAILATQFNSFVKGMYCLNSVVGKSPTNEKPLGPSFHSHFKSLLGDGVFNVDGTSFLCLVALTPLTDHDWIDEMWKCVHITLNIRLSSLTRTSKVPPSNDPTIFHSRTY